MELFLVQHFGSLLMMTIYFFLRLHECSNSGEESPTGGTAFVFGKDICLYPKAIRQHVCINFSFIFLFWTTSIDRGVEGWVLAALTTRTTCSHQLLKIYYYNLRII